MVPVIRVHRGLSPPSMCALTGAPKEAGTLFEKDAGFMFTN